MHKIKKSLTTAVALAIAAVSGLPAMAIEANLDQTKGTDFALKLFKNSATDTSKNVLVSPFSAYEALSMAANGAAGSTREAMATTLGVTGGTMDGLNTRNNAVLKSLNANTSVRMEIANAIYADKNTRFKSSFVKLCQDLYQAEARTEDFADPDTVRKINAWCDQKTHGKIKEIISKLTPREKMVLLNSVYFKGSWDKAFKKENTQQQDFTLLSGATKKVAMMHKSFEPGYLKGKGFQATCLPYAGNNQAMYIFLPDKGSDFAVFAAKFTPDNWHEWMNGFYNTKVRLAMPKYKVEYFTVLNGALTAMGMGEAFGGRANFSEMFETQAGCISRVLQKTYMDVNEEGTEAAAVTAVIMAARAMRVESPPVEFVVDRPFVVALVDRNTNEILFLGSIVDPKSE